MKVVIALGGNALLRRGEPLEAGVLRVNIGVACGAIAEVATAHELVLTHGNGPQVGLLALQTAACEGKVEPYPLDVLGAESEGMIGYILEQELMNRLPERRFANLITQTLVDPGDPAFGRPDKFVGPIYDIAEAVRLTRDHGWIFREDGANLRRVVPSPTPTAILELDAIRHLVEGGFLVICTGGGGVPVTREEGLVQGVEAVIDKDRASCLLAQDLEADWLLMLTDVDAVYSGWGSSEAYALSHTTPDGLDRFSFAAGSMGPKVEAACEFVRSGGKMAGIGSPGDVMAILAGEAGTVVHPD
ncbi:carbamate kinase (plasmid) [Verrucomicrobiaceae bacterium 227]